jgi:O-antigen/teichoic acid export membrane protein
MEPDDELTDVAGRVRRRAIAGVRGSLALTLATLPLSFLTNVVLGRVSPQALGYYSAIQIFIGSYYTFLVFGGIYVFTRFVPAIPRRDRLSFFLSYSAIVASVSVLAAGTVVVALPDLASRLLSRFGSPAPAVAAGLLGVALAWGFGSYFLFSVLESARATAVEKSVVVGFFVAAVLGFGPLRDRLTEDPARFLWWAALAVYSGAAVIAVVFVVGTEEFRLSDPIRWILPHRFWPTVAYTHFDTIVNYVYSTLSPVLVLLWLDVAALGRLSAALRYVLLLTVLPATMNSVIAPAVSRLDAAGLRDEAFRQTAAAMRTAALGIVPAAIVLILFADDAMALFGSGFRDSGDILRLAALSLAAAPAVHLGGGLAAGLGAFRAYLMASSVYVLATLGASAVLVPMQGVRGAAIALSLGALVRHVAILSMLRARFRFPWPGRLAAGWVCCALALTVAMTLRPGRPVACALAAAVVAAFALFGRVTFAELRALGSKAVRGS